MDFSSAVSGFPWTPVSRCRPDCGVVFDKVEFRSNRAGAGGLPCARTQAPIRSVCEDWSVTYSLTVDETKTTVRDPDLVSHITWVHAVIAAVADRFGAGDIHVDLVLADDFVAATQEILDLGNGGSASTFTTERLGGETVAKNLPLSDDGSHVAIVMNRQLLSGSGDVAAHSAYLVAHELMHPVLNWLRHESGVLDGVVVPSSTPQEIARSIARIISDEYRADRIASVILGQFACVTEGGQEVPLNAGHIFGDSYTQQFLQVLDDRVWPGWADAVNAYRVHATDLDAMWQRIVMDTDQTLTLLAHAQAVADASDLDGPLDGEAASHEGVVLYLEPVWESFLAAYDEHRLFENVAEFADADNAVSDALEAALMALWERLGLTFTVYEDRSMYIHVNDPER